MSVKITRLTASNTRALRDLIDADLIDASTVEVTATTLTVRVSAAESVPWIEGVKAGALARFGGRDSRVASLHAVVRKLRAAAEDAEQAAAEQWAEPAPVLTERDRAAAQAERERKAAAELAPGQCSNPDVEHPGFPCNHPTRETLAAWEADTAARSAAEGPAPELTGHVCMCEHPSHGPVCIIRADVRGGQCATCATEHPNHHPDAVAAAQWSAELATEDPADAARLAAEAAERHAGRYAAEDAERAALAAEPVPVIRPAAWIRDAAERVAADQADDVCPVCGEPVTMHTLFGRLPFDRPAEFWHAHVGQHARPSVVAAELAGITPAELAAEDPTPWQPAGLSALDYPAANGQPVTDAHARLCAERGHATWTRDGKVSPVCPRCGDVTDSRPDTPDVQPGRHVTGVEHVGGRYPYRPTCSCGRTFQSYVARHAAQDMADAHERGEL